MNPEDEKAGVRNVLAQLGASSEQSEVMAEQICKRATQLAQERGVTREAAMQQLLQLVIKGRSGETYDFGASDRKTDDK